MLRGVLEILGFFGAVLMSLVDVSADIATRSVTIIAYVADAKRPSRLSEFEFNKALGRHACPSAIQVMDLD